jgi:NADH-quinone oxidoreductase subunit E
LSLDDTTRDELREIAGRYPEARSALLPMLHLVQSVEGCVTVEGIETCAEMLDLSAAEVSGVATFYTMYKRRPMGEHHVGVCTNTLCAVMGGDAIFERLKDHLEVGNDETTADGKVSLEHIECNAACDFAPVMTVNWEFFDQQTPESAVELVDRLRAGEKVTSTRGATITSWRAAERVLAGFEDGLVDEGPAAAGPTLVGLEIARENGWEAPSVNGSGGTKTAAATESPEQAAEQADTSRAESETKVDESPADQQGGGADDD